MARRLNIEPQLLPHGSVADLLNGAFASLSGPVGFTPTQPRLLVKSVSITNNDSSIHSGILYKGASGGSDSGTEIANASVGPLSTMTYTVDQVFESGDFLTGTADASSKLVVNISVEIDF